MNQNPSFTHEIGSLGSLQSLSSAITQSTTSPTGANCFVYSLVQDVDQSLAFSEYYVTPGTLPTSITFGPVNNNEIGDLATKDIKFKLRAQVNINTATPVYSVVTLTLVHECTQATMELIDISPAALSVHNLGPQESTSIPDYYLATQPAALPVDHCFEYGLYASITDTVPITTFTTAPVFESLVQTTLSIGGTTSYGT